MTLIVQMVVRADHLGACVAGSKGINLTIYILPIDLFFEHIALGAFSWVEIQNCTHCLADPWGSEGWAKSGNSSYFDMHYIILPRKTQYSLK